MSKRPSLAETMRQAVAADAPPVTPAANTPEERPREATVRRSGFRAATREGKKKVTAAIDPGVHKKLKRLAVERDTTTEALLTEAIADLLAKHR